MDDEQIVREIYSIIDRHIYMELERLDTLGIRTSCSNGCFHCCNQNIITTSLEVAALVSYMKRVLDKSRLDALRERTRLWIQWDSRRWGAQDAKSDIGHPKQAPFCPVLVDGSCSAYEMRPSICRLHLVSSDPRSCRELNIGKSGRGIRVMETISANAASAEALIRNEIVRRGENPFEQTTLLSHGINEEMGWGFT